MVLPRITNSAVFWVTVGVWVWNVGKFTLVGFILEELLDS